MALRLNPAARNGILDSGINTLFDGGTLQIRTGAPATAITDPAAGTLLASITLPADAFAAASNGAVALQGTWQDATADGTGTAGHFRLLNAAGTAVIDGTITTTGLGGDMTVANTSIVSGQGPITITSFSITLPAGG